MSGRLVGLAAVCLLLYAGPVRAQAYRPDPATGEQGSANIKIVSHLPLNVSAPYNTSDIEIEQELSRPYVYVDHANEAGARSPTIGFDIISIKDPGKPQVIYTWHIENQELHRGAGSLGPTYIKTHGRYYFFNGFQFQVGGPDVDLGAIVWDVTGLPDTSKIKEVARSHEIPTVENVSLARALYRSVELEQEIPIELYKAVAEVLAYVFKVRKRSGSPS